MPDEAGEDDQQPGRASSPATSFRWPTPLVSGSGTSLVMVAATDRQQSADGWRIAATVTAVLRFEGSGGDRGRHGVAGVVEPVAKSKVPARSSTRMIGLRSWR